MQPFWVSVFLDFAPESYADGVAFWCAVTGYELSPARGEHDQFATLLAPEGDAYLKVQRLGEGPSRLHVDLHEQRDSSYDVRTSPAGFTYCRVGHPGAARPSPAAWSSGRSQVDQICLDIPAAVYDAECAFWRELTGWDPTPTDSPEFRRLDGVGMPLRFLLQRVDDVGPMRAHLDMSADDPPAEVHRHLGLGATFVRPGRGWTVLRDPAGMEYCITDRRPRG